MKLIILNLIVSLTTKALVIQTFISNFISAKLFDKHNTEIDEYNNRADINESETDINQQ